MNGPDVPPFALTGRELLPPLPPVTWRSARLNVAFFLLTAVCVFRAHMYVPGHGGLAVFSWAAGFQGVAATLAILAAHEFGHYFAARRYRVDTSLPYFIPFPIPALNLFGTMGAFMRIRSQIPSRRALFDIGVAGPLAGFLVCLPVLALGVLDAHWVPTPSSEGGISLGEPLAFSWAVSLLKGSEPNGMTLLIGPLGLSAWFGLFLTALNLIPVGQLDGGHAVHALMPSQSRWISRLGIVGCLGLVYLRPTWMLWAFILLVLGRSPHPPTADRVMPPGRGRIFVGLLTLAVFTVCFTPNPVLVSWPEFLDGMSALARLVIGLFGFTSR